MYLGEWEDVGPVPPELTVVKRELGREGGPGCRWGGVSRPVGRKTTPGERIRGRPRPSQGWSLHPGLAGRDDGDSTTNPRGGRVRVCNAISKRLVRSLFYLPR